MALSDSMFLFEIVVEELESFVNYRDFTIVSQFANVFTLNLKNPHELGGAVPKKPCKKNHKTKVRDYKTKSEKHSVKPKVNRGQSVLIANSADALMSSMRTYPLQLCLCPHGSPEYTLGSAIIPWAPAYIAYLNDIIRKRDNPSVAVEGKYNIFDEISSKRMASIKLNIKLSCFKDKLTTQLTPLSENGAEPKCVYSGFGLNSNTIVSTFKQKQIESLANEPGVIKTKYSCGKKVNRKDNRRNNNSYKLVHTISHTIKQKNENTTKLNQFTEMTGCSDSPVKIDEIKENIDDLVKSNTDIEVNKQVAVVKSKSYSKLEYKNNFNTLNYIFGDGVGHFGNKIYCVGYFTVQSDAPSDHQEGFVKDTNSSEKASEPKEKYKYKICDSKCPSKKAISGTRSLSHCSLDLPADAAPLISLIKCDRVECNAKSHREPPPPPDSRIMLDLTSLKKDCCDVKVSEKVEQVLGGMTAKLQIGNDPCLCSCECRFGFTKKTTYCNICGGYEKIGEELARRPGHEMPFPCPIFHKLVDKNKLKTYSGTGSDSKKRVDDSQRNLKTGSKSEKRSLAGDRESEKDSKKGKKKKKDERFKFNYGYQGIPPQIGHSQCAMPCTGTLGNVPKSMGWLWTAEDVPGMKFRPNWKPGATNKHVVRLLRMARNPGEVISKKRKKDTGKKRPLKRPLLIVHKKDGEYTVTMETMKAYNRQRALNQHPYEDKPVVTYTIGRSEEENRERRKKKERVQRRLERAQRHFIQSAFKDMCKDICLKTYQQALGILPDAEDPECTCYPAEPGPDRTNIDVSCSCSEDSTSLGSDTDSDEWIVEFTPPNALFDPTYKGKKVIKVDNTTQYTYLDYRVKLIDRLGNPVPRFFKGPDGKQQCSDLGGFWSPDHKWLEINVDGFIAPDNRWAPNSFFGPNGEQVDAENGKFQAANGKWLVLGIDGYIDSQGRWRFYPKLRGSPSQRKQRPQAKKGDKGKTMDEKKPVAKASEATWSCFGDASPKDLGRMGIMGHGLDRKLLLATLKEMMARGEDVTIPQPPSVPRRPEGIKGRKRANRGDGHDLWNYEGRTKCHHSVPSEKGIVAVDARGNKTYFRLKDFKNTRPKQRLAHLDKQGISLSSFHVPCFNSFINSEVMKQQQRERCMALATHGKSVATQATF